MSRQCVPVEQFGELQALAPTHPWWRHLQACARCRSRYLSYTEFLGADTVDAGARPQAARAHLDRLIEREFRPARPRHASWRWRLMILAPATCAALAAVLLVTRPERRDADVPVLRGDVVPAGPRIVATVVADDGGLLLSWEPVAGATSYRIGIFDEGLRPLFETSVGGCDFGLIPGRDLPAASEGAELVWRVTALEGSQEIARSEVGVIRLPRR